MLSMLRPPFPNDIPLLVTTVVQRRTRIFSRAVYAREAIETLYRVQALRPFFLYAFVVMPDHCHLLLKVPVPISLSAIMNRFKMGVSHSLGLGPIWQPRFHAKTAENVPEAIRYIHHNPVRAGIVPCADEFPWSSACGRWDVTERGCF